MPMSRHPFRSHRSAPHPRAILAIAAALALGGGQAWGAWSAAGVVKTTTGTALAVVDVTVKDSSTYKTTTNDKGEFKLESSAGVGSFIRSSKFSIQRSGDALVIGYPGEGLLEVSLLDASGSLLWNEHAALVQGVARAQVPARGRDLAAILRVRLGTEIHSQVMPLGGKTGWSSIPAIAARSMAVTYPVLVFKKAGYADTTLALTQETSNGLAVAMRALAVPPVDDFVEDHRSECTIPALPAVSALTNNSFLPDPFKMLDGKTMTSKDQAKCRREEIGAMVEKYVMGDKPRNPEKVEGSLSGNKLTVKVTDKGKSVSFAVTITKPSGSGPFPAVIGLDGGSLGNSYSSLPVATISFPEFTIASEGSGRGKGVFYDLYGSNASAGELMAWAWGVSRVIDALIATPAAGIDPKKLAITGCSRLGKGAFVIGAFDQRIALVIPQESGTGGLSAWRIVAATSGAQPVANAAGEQYWMRADFSGNFANSTGKLPFDNHAVAGFIAPRGFLFFDNSIDWLGPAPGYGTAIAAKEVYAAMGVSEAFTYSSVGGHTHCSLPAGQNHWVQSYIKKYLLGQTGEADKIEGPYSFDKAKWINWTTPTLK